jgi:copper homeostasis protein
VTAPVLVEACVDSVASARAAAAGGAGRIELCADLTAGGTTPSAGMIAACRAAVGIPLFVLIRPRAGDFLHSDDELEVMRRDVVAARSLGVDGVVLGALRADGTVDAERVRPLIELAFPLPVTFHRAFDFTRDVDEALEALLAIGVPRVLTSGGAQSAAAGLLVLARLVRRAGERLTVMAGGGVTEDNVSRVVAESGVREVHVRVTRAVASAMVHRPDGVSLARPAPGPWERAETDAERVARVVAAARDMRE